MTETTQPGRPVSPADVCPMPTETEWRDAGFDVPAELCRNPGTLKVSSLVAGIDHCMELLALTRRLIDAGWLVDGRSKIQVVSDLHQLAAMASQLAAEVEGRKKP